MNAQQEPPYVVKLPNGSATLMFSCTPEERNTRIAVSKARQQERLNKNIARKMEEREATRWLQEQNYHIFYAFLPEYGYHDADNQFYPLWDWVTSVAWKREEDAIVGAFTILSFKDQFSRPQGRIELVKKLQEKTHPYCFGFTLDTRNLAYTDMVNAIIDTIESMAKSRPKIFPRYYPQDILRYSNEVCPCHECTQ